MKKMLCMVLALAFLFALSGMAFAADMGVQVIPGPEAETEPLDLDDLKINTEVEIEGWGILTATECTFVDRLGKLDKDGWRDGQYSSGAEAEYLLLRMDVVNTTLKAKNYLADVTVEVVYDDLYEFSGWFYQYDYDKYEDRVIPSDCIFAIDPMYAGHYVFGCTLPNAVVEGSRPLAMIITIDGNEITYNVRK